MQHPQLQQTDLPNVGQDTDERREMQSFQANTSSSSDRRNEIQTIQD